MLLIFIENINGLLLWEKDTTTTNTFEKKLGKSNSKPNKRWVDKGGEFYNRSWLPDNDIEMYSTRNEGKSVVAEKFIRTLKNKSSKYKTSISRNVHIDRLVDIVDKYSWYS